MERTAAEDGTPTNEDGKAGSPSLSDHPPVEAPRLLDAQAMGSAVLESDPDHHSTAPESLPKTTIGSPAPQLPPVDTPEHGDSDGGNQLTVSAGPTGDHEAGHPSVSEFSQVEAPHVLGAEALGRGLPATDGHAVEAPHALGAEASGSGLPATDGHAADTSLPEASLIPLTEMPGLMAPQVEPPVPAMAFWRRSIVLGGVVAALGGLTLWEHSTIPDRPASPVITVATPAPNATPLDPGMADALRKVRTALVAHDVVTVSGMVDPDGLVVGPYAGGIPESGYPIPETKSFLSNVMTDARLVTPGWRTDPRGRIFLLVDGWRTRPLSLSPNSTLELTPLVAIVMHARNGVWAIRWFLIDATGILTQQARNVTWQAVP